MLHLRILTKALVALALLGTALTLAASPASAQKIEVITFENEDTADTEVAWEMRVTVVSLGGCTPTQGLGAEGFVTGWLSEGSQSGVALDTGTCSYDFTAQARRKNNSEVCDAQLAWGEGATEGFEDRLNSGSSARSGESFISVKHKTPMKCQSSVTATFSINPSTVVKALPATSRDDALTSRVRRAVEVTDFTVSVRPHLATRNTQGCNLSFSFIMRGGTSGAVKRSLDGTPIGSMCQFQAFITNDPSPFTVVTGGTTFTTSAGTITVDLSPQLKIEPARIWIIQDVVGSAGNVGVSYGIVRSCAGINALPPAITPTGGPGLYLLPGGGWRVTLLSGRHTVHSNLSPNFGPGVTYQAAARSLTSTVVEGCTVTVTISHVPAGCVVAGGNTQTLTWTRSRPFADFGFEFDITCSGVAAQPPTSAVDLPPPPPSSTPPADMAGSSVGDNDVRIVARQLSNGKLEFGLQQRQQDNSWGTRVLPKARLFPSNTPVGRWLVSSTMTLWVAETADALVEEIRVRIVARKWSDDRVEFGLQQQNDSGSWGPRHLPDRRFFPKPVIPSNWLSSTQVSLDT